MLLTFYIKTFKILTCSVLILGLKLYRFGLFSKGFYCLLFNVLFCSVFSWNVLHYTIPFLVCQYFFRLFSKKFQTIFEQNKKLVIIVFILFIKFIFITNSFLFLSVARYFHIITLSFLNVNTFFIFFYKILCIS